MLPAAKLYSSSVVSHPSSAVASSAKEDLYVQFAIKRLLLYTGHVGERNIHTPVTRSPLPNAPAAFLAPTFPSALRSLSRSHLSLRSRSLSRSHLSQRSRSLSRSHLSLRSPLPFSLSPFPPLPLPFSLPPPLSAPFLALTFAPTYIPFNNGLTAIKRVIKSHKKRWLKGHRVHRPAGQYNANLQLKK